VVLDVFSGELPAEYFLRVSTGLENIQQAATVIICSDGV
jgi:hypothetical protein